MESTSIQSSLQPELANQATPDPNAMDTSMDIDMDLDLGPLPEPEPMEPEPASTTPAPDEAAALVVNGDPQFEKVHIRGVDELATDDVKRFATEHFGEEEPARVEWVDDTSANLIYSSTEVGIRALAEFTQPSTDEDTSSFPSLRLRNAKSLSTHPDSVLQVRSAVTADRKKHRAHEVSRFYLMHPEHDPRERMRHEFSGRRSRGRRDGSTDDYRRRRFDDKEHRRRKEGGDTFSANMYDDNVEPGEDGAVNGRGEGRNGYELFPSDSGQSHGRLRNRSASPNRLGTGQGHDGSRRRFRDRSPRRVREDDYARLNTGKELFSSEPGSSDEGSNRRELFPDRTASSYLKKELFPSKTSSSNHRRSDAFDAADETAELFSKRMSLPLTDGADDSAGGEARSNENHDVELFPDRKRQNGLNVRGAASEDQGAAIRGASQGISIKGAASIRELFPANPTGNEGKELFSDRLDGRGGRRKKAQDMFS